MPKQPKPHKWTVSIRSNGSFHSGLVEALTAEEAIRSFASKFGIALANATEVKTEQTWDWINLRGI